MRNPGVGLQAGGTVLVVGQCFAAHPGCREHSRQGFCRMNLALT